VPRYLCLHRAGVIVHPDGHATLDFGRSPAVVDRFERLDRRAQMHDRDSRKQDRDRAALDVTEQGGPPAADRVHDRADIIHTVLGAAAADLAIRDTSAAAVENDGAGEARETPQMSAVARVVRVPVDVGRQARNDTLSIGPSPKT